MLTEKSLKMLVLQFRLEKQHFKAKSLAYQNFRPVARWGAQGHAPPLFTPEGGDHTI